MHTQNGLERIRSIRETLAGSFRKPEPSEVDKYILALSNNRQASEYLSGRGLSSETVSHFRLGYSEERDAIAIPVYKNGELVNIRYRHLNEKATAKYTQEKGCEVWLYNDDGVELGKKKGGILIVEGEFDLMSAWQAGFKNVVSPASGKDSYGVWIELLDQISRVYIAYDNDQPGKIASLAMADRIGIDKSFEVLYPEGIKDTNEYFLKYNEEDFRDIIKSAQPYYKHKFSGVGDIVDQLRDRPSDRLVLDSVPFVKWKSNWLGILTADSGGGKTTYALNIADELVSKDIPTLFLPFERGIKEVGERYLQVRYRKQEEDLATLSEPEWQGMKDDAVSVPLYFSMPSEDEFFDTVRRAKRLFNTRFIIVDHLDYFIHGKEWVQEQADIVRKFKELCIELDIVMLVVHHIKKPEGGRRRKKLSKEDMKGSSAIYQIAEVVILMYPHDDGRVVIDVDKNKGPMGFRYCKVDMSTGRFEKPSDVSREELDDAQRIVDETWENE